MSRIKHRPIRVIRDIKYGPIRTMSYIKYRPKRVIRERKYGPIYIIKKKYRPTYNTSHIDKHF